MTKGIFKFFNYWTLCNPIRFKNIYNCFYIIIVYALFSIGNEFIIFRYYFTMLWPVFSQSATKAARPLAVRG